MKRSSLLALLFLICSSLYAQQYFDENWKKCSASKAVYIVDADKSGENSHRVRIKEDDEILSEYAVYRTNDFCSGEYTRFNADGDTLVHMFYKNSKPEGIYRFWKNGKTLFKKSNYKDGKEDGISEVYFPNGQISARYKMEEGNSVESDFWNEDGSVQENRHYANFFPTFLGMMYSAFSDWVTERLVYPAECVSRNVQGEVRLKIKIDEYGKIQDIKVLRSPHKLMSKEAVRVVKLSPDWTPGFKHNQVSTTTIVLPVHFKLK